MSRVRLGMLLALRDLQRRGAETLLLFLALVAAATTMTIGLVLHGQTAAPYAATRQQTVGPDVVSVLFPAPGRTVTDGERSALATLAGRPEVAARSLPFPTTWASIRTHGMRGVAEVQGRDPAASPVDRPRLVGGRWVGGPGVVVERAFARALGLRVGDRVALGGHVVAVRGIAVSAALPPYPQLCTIGCILDRPDWFSAQPGLVWVTRAQAAALATAQEPLVWFQYLRLDPGVSPRRFAAAYGDGGPPAGHPELTAWQDVAGRQAEQIASERAVVVFGSTLLVVLALATLVVLVGGRMSDEVRRVGILKAAGATPGFVVRLLLTSYLAVGVVAALTGVAIGRSLAPRLVTVSAGLLGRVGATVVSARDVAVVVASVLVIVVAACAVPAFRAARTSTLGALRQGGRPSRRHPNLLALSARLPGPLLLGLRITARRPRRCLLTGLSVTVAVCGAYVVLQAQASLDAEHGYAGAPVDPQVAQLHAVMATLSVLLTVMAGINLVFLTQASAVDARGVLALARTVGVSPVEGAVALAAAQLVPAVLGLLVGGVAGDLLFHGLAPSHPVPAPWAQLGALVVLTLVLVGAFTAAPALREGRRPLADSLREA